MSRMGTSWGFSVAEKRTLIIFCIALLAGSSYRLYQKQLTPHEVSLTRADSAAVSAIRETLLTAANKQNRSSHAKSHQSVDIQPVLLDVNTASTEMLESLPGIGPVLADRILTERSERGSFDTVDELLEVKGIGEKKLEAIRTHLVCLPLPAAN